VVVGNLDVGRRHGDAEAAIVVVSGDELAILVRGDTTIALCDAGRKDGAIRRHGYAAYINWNRVMPPGLTERVRQPGIYHHPWQDVFQRKVRSFNTTRARLKRAETINKHQGDHCAEA